LKTNFERVKDILDILCQKHPSTSGPTVRQSIAQLSSSYLGLHDPAREAVDYSSIHAQIGYLYEYVPANADLIFQTLVASASHAHDLLKKTAISMACIGGGPGTELLGLFKYAERRPGKVASIACDIWDHNTPWSAVHRAVASTAPSGITSKIDLEEFNWLTKYKWGGSKYGYQLVTLSYTLSEVWRSNKTGIVSENVDGIICSLHPGTLIIYSDNRGDNFDPNFKSHFLDRPDLEVVSNEDYTHMLIGSDEQASVLAPYREWLGSGAPMSKLTGRATCAALVKV
jgi:hypothetical protein